ncbi:dienelactone hydrolase [Ilyonectria robusta]|uniref:dienelactone hydrolase n=1 Tax=Ilyonectria robusta TaxID=1079257 RepID=UPI001E8E18A3|nr:dienelactone hydrolase [Ilyonectria robusta]KAH8734207.1 dienelactone hydrolase [Ilyonectria robusta]
MASTSCCFQGSEWGGEPSGVEGELAENDTYITGQESDNGLAILIIHDAFGWKFRNIRLLADKFARELNAIVYVPDFFGGMSLPFEPMLDGRFHELDLDTFNKENSREKREPEILACAQALRATNKHVAAVGFCFGGWGCFHLAAKKHVTKDGHPLLDCISVAHPSRVTTEDVDAVAVPIQLLIQFEPAFTADIQSYTLSTLPKLGVPWKWEYFPGVEHGALSRGNPEKPGEVQAMKRAATSVITWIKTFTTE